MKKCCKKPKLIYVEYDYTNPQYWDGWSESYCSNCKTRVGRWSMKVLKDGEFEDKRLRFKETAQNETKGDMK